MSAQRSITIDDRIYTKIDYPEDQKEHRHDKYQNLENNEFVIKLNPKAPYYKKNLIDQNFKVHRKTMNSKKPNIVLIKKIMKMESDIILMEKGQDLNTFLDRSNLRQLLCCLHQIASGIQQMHSLGILHRDIKLSNLIVVQEENHYVVKFIDFDISIDIFSDYELDGQGTTGYKAPELEDPKQILKEDYTKMDIWSFGVLACNLLFGLQINQTEGIHNQIDKYANANIHKNPLFEQTYKQLRQLMKDILQIDPKKRLDNYEIIDRLNKIQRDQPIFIADQYILTRCQNKYMDRKGNTLQIDLENILIRSDEYSGLIIKHLSRLQHVSKVELKQFLLTLINNFERLRQQDTHKDCFLEASQTNYQYPSLMEAIQHNLIYQYLNKNQETLSLLTLEWNDNDWPPFFNKLIRYHTIKQDNYCPQMRLLKMNMNGKTIYYYLSSKLDLKEINLNRILPIRSTENMLKEPDSILYRCILHDIDVIQHDQNPDYLELLRITYCMISASARLWKYNLMFCLADSYLDHVIKLKRHGQITFACTCANLRQLNCTAMEIIKGIQHFVMHSHAEYRQQPSIYVLQDQYQSFQECRRQLKDLIVRIEHDQSSFSHQELSQIQDSQVQIAHPERFTQIVQGQCQDLASLPSRSYTHQPIIDQDFWLISQSVFQKPPNSDYLQLQKVQKLTLIDYSDPKDLYQAIRTEVQASSTLFKEGLILAEFGKVVKYKIQDSYIYQVDQQCQPVSSKNNIPQIIEQSLSYWKTHIDKLYGEEKIRLTKMFYDKQFNQFEDIPQETYFQPQQLLKYFAVKNRQYELIKPIYNEVLEAMRTELLAAEELFNHYQYGFTKQGNVVKQLVKNQYIYFNNVAPSQNQPQQIHLQIQAYWRDYCKNSTKDDKFYLRNVLNKQFANSQTLISAIESKLPHQVPQLDQIFIQQVSQLLNKDQILYLDRVLLQYELKFPKDRKLRQLYRGYDQEEFRSLCCDQGPTLMFLNITSQLQSQLYAHKTHVIAIYMPISYQQNGEFLSDREAASFIVSLTKQKLYILDNRNKDEILYCGEGGQGELQILLGQDLIIVFTEDGYPQINEYRLESYLPPGEVEDGKITILDELAPPRDLYVQELIVYGFEQF